jgi:hypothetical protein
VVLTASAHNAVVLGVCGSMLTLEPLYTWHLSDAVEQRMESGAWVGEGTIKAGELSAIPSLLLWVRKRARSEYYLQRKLEMGSETARATHITNDIGSGL